jgi:hypothetical protein
MPAALPFSPCDASPAVPPHLQEFLGALLFQLIGAMAGDPLSVAFTFAGLQCELRDAAGPSHRPCMLAALDAPHLPPPGALQMP